MATDFGNGLWQRISNGLWQRIERIMDRDKKVSTPYDELTYKIIGCAMAVHRGLGPGHREHIYQRDLQWHFAEARLSYEPQKLFEVFESPNNGVLLGYYVPDFVVEEKVIVEIKAIQALDNSHLAQVISYLAVSGCLVGLLINFGQRSLQYKRVFPPKSLQDHLANPRWLVKPDWLKAGHDRGG
jgi:GxxExxY protein